MTTLISQYKRVFAIPALVALGIGVYAALSVSDVVAEGLRTGLILAVILLGSAPLLFETAEKLLHKNLAIDYIALAAIFLGVATGEYVAAAIIVLMLSGGSALEVFASERARSELSKLKDRIPNAVTVMEASGERNVDIASVALGAVVLVKKGEVVPLDGKLTSAEATIDESSLTGEAAPVEKLAGDLVRSGTVNVGEAVTVAVTAPAQESTYKKITDMVLAAQNNKTGFIRLADRYSALFTLATFGIAAFAYLVTQDPERVLAVLVIATPCPLIIATPIALMGGANSASRQSIVIKSLAVLEIVAKCRSIVFDKTGTLTLGTPKLVAINLDSGSESQEEKEVLKIAAALERNSLHPFAKSIVAEARARNLARASATEVREILGQGISGTVAGRSYRIAKADQDGHTGVTLFQGEQTLAHFVFDDVIKPDVRAVLNTFHKQGYDLSILSGDKPEKVEALARTLAVPLTAIADVLPESKLAYIQSLQDRGQHVIMVGDGINDAPALAKADVGLVYSHEEYTASAAAGDAILLKNDIQSVATLISISDRTIAIALQSIYIGLGLSIAGMLLASGGLIAPVAGAIIQEVIDVSVIFNSLRTARLV